MFLSCLWYTSWWNIPVFFFKVETLSATLNFLPRYVVMNAPLLGLSSRAFTVVCRVGNNQLSSINLDIAILKKPYLIGEVWNFIISLVSLEWTFQTLSIASVIIPKFVATFMRVTVHWLKWKWNPNIALLWLDQPVATRYVFSFILISFCQTSK